MSILSGKGLLLPEGWGGRRRILWFAMGAVVLVFAFLLGKSFLFSNEETVSENSIPLETPKDENAVRAEQLSDLDRMTQGLPAYSEETLERQERELDASAGKFQSVDADVE